MEELKTLGEFFGEYYIQPSAQHKGGKNSPHVPIHQKNCVIYVREEEEEQDGAEEHCHPRSMVFTKHF